MVDEPTKLHKDVEKVITDILKDVREILIKNYLSIINDPFVKNDPQFTTDEVRQRYAAAIIRKKYIPHTMMKTYLPNCQLE